MLRAIRRLLTVLSRVDRAPGGAWPTLLVSKIRANIGLCPRAKAWPATLKMPALETLEGRTLGASRTWEKLDRTSCDSICISRAPLAFGIFLKTMRFFVSSVIKSRRIRVLRFIIMSFRAPSTCVTVVRRLSTAAGNSWRKGVAGTAFVGVSSVAGPWRGGRVDRGGWLAF